MVRNRRPAGTPPGTPFRGNRDESVHQLIPGDIASSCETPREAPDDAKVELALALKDGTEIWVRGGYLYRITGPVLMWPATERRHAADASPNQD